MLESDIPKRPQDRNRKKPPIANEFALGYTYQDVLDADQEGHNCLTSLMLSFEGLKNGRYSGAPIHLSSL